VVCAIAGSGPAASCGSGICVGNLLLNCCALRVVPVQVAAWWLLQGLPFDADESDVHAVFCGEAYSRHEAGLS
jgi:hypothetical protein